MHRITAATLLASVLVVAPAAVSQAAAAPDAGQVASERSATALGGELWEYRETFESMSTCSFVGRWGLITAQWKAWYCEWDAYRDGYSLWVRVA
jgi:hypothetical protein